MRVIVYVDGFNLYYRLKEHDKNGTKCKWLNLDTLFRHYYPGATNLKIKYFTADVHPQINDQNTPVRQQMYLRALNTFANIEIIKGQFRRREKFLPLVPSYKIYIRNACRIIRQKIYFSFLFIKTLKLPVSDFTSKNRHQYARVIKSEEKGSDVNLAVNLVNDAHNNLFDLAVVVSNDADLKNAIKIVTQELGLKVDLLNPHPTTVIDLQKFATGRIRIRPKVLVKHQLPTTMNDGIGTFSKPPAW